MVSKLAAALATPKKPIHGPSCAVKLILVELSDEIDRKALENALRLDSGITGEQIAAALRDEGFGIKGHTVQRHRNGKCDCGAL